MNTGLTRQLTPEERTWIEDGEYDLHEVFPRPVNEIVAEAIELEYRGGISIQTLAVQYRLHPAEVRRIVTMGGAK